MIDVRGATRSHTRNCRSGQRAFWLLSAILLAAAGLQSVPDTPAHAADACVVTDKLVNPCRPWLGANAGNYPDIASDAKSQITGHENRIGRQVDVVHLFHAPGTRPMSSVDTYYATRPNTILSVNWKPATTWSDAGGTNSTVNASIDAAADDIKALGPTKIMLTIFHEPENDVTGGADGCADIYKGTSGTPADYRAMWRNVRQRFDAKGVTNVVYVMNYMGFAAWDCMVDDLWPGNDLVDWVVWDPYSETTSWSETVGRFYGQLTAASDATHDYGSKPWGLGEWSVWRNATQDFTYQYYAEARASIAANEFPKLKMFNVFDNSVTTPGTARIAYDSNDGYDQNEVESYKALANDATFSGTWSYAPDTTAPSVQITSPAAGATVSGTVGVSASVRDDVGAQTSSLMVDGVVVATTGAAGATTVSFAWDSTTVTEGTHTLVVTATDGAGNVGTSSSVAVTVAPPDTQLPTAPSAPIITENTSQRVTLSWTSATDNVGVAYYQVLRDGAVVADNVDTTSYADSSVQPQSTYRYAVRAVDAAGNVGPPSAETSVTTPAAPDTQVPTKPLNLKGTAGVGSVDLSWSASSDNVRVTGYDVYQDGVVVGTSSGTSFSVTGLKSRTSYKFAVQAFDAAGNRSALSKSTSVRTR